MSALVYIQSGPEFFPIEHWPLLLMLQLIKRDGLQNENNCAQVSDDVHVPVPEKNRARK